MGAEVRLVFVRVDEGAGKFTDYALGQDGVSAMAMSDGHLTIKKLDALIGHPTSRCVTQRYEPAEKP